MEQAVKTVNKEHVAKTVKTAVLGLILSVVLWFLLMILINRVTVIGDLVLLVFPFAVHIITGAPAGLLAARLIWTRRRVQLLAAVLWTVAWGGIILPGLLPLSAPFIIPILSPLVR